jgi:hypothetical protein
MAGHEHILSPLYIHFQTSLPVNLQQRDLLCLFFCDIYVFAQYNNIISTDQELMYSIQFQSFLTFLDVPEGIF